MNESTVLYTEPVAFSNIQLESHSLDSQICPFDQAYVLVFPTAAFAVAAAPAVAAFAVAAGVVPAAAAALAVDAAFAVVAAAAAAAFHHPEKETSCDP